MNVVSSFLRAWVGEEEYLEARYGRSRSRSFPIRFWGRIALASLGLCFFLWQQVVEPAGWWRSDGFGLFVLALGASQAAGPCVYLFLQGTERVFFTKHFREAALDGRFYVTRWSALCVVLMTALSILAVAGWLGSNWYIKPLVFLCSVPVICFWVVFPAYSWAAGRGRDLPQEGHSD